MSFGYSILANSLAWLALCLSIVQIAIVPDCPCQRAGNCACAPTSPAKPHVSHKARCCGSHACHSHKAKKHVRKAGLRVASTAHGPQVGRTSYHCPPTCSCRAGQMPLTSLPMTDKDNRSLEITALSVHVAFEVPAAEATKGLLLSPIDHLAGSSRHLCLSLCRLIV